MLILDQLRKGDRQLQLLAAGVLAGLVVLVTGLWYVQVVSVKRYEADLRTQQFRTVRVPAIRGKILDRNRLSLAENRPNHTIYLYLEELTRLFHHEYTNHVKRSYTARFPKQKPTRVITDELERYARYLVVSNLVQRLATILNEPVTLDEPRFSRHYLTQRALPFAVLENLNPAQVARFVESGSDLPGVELEIRPLRAYPHNTLAAHILGHLQRDDQTGDEEGDLFNYRLPDFKGEAGLESLFDDELRGRPGGRSILVNNLNYRQSVTEWAKPEPGKNLVLTIDLVIQRAAEQAMKSSGPDARAAAVVMDVHTGDLLALGSSPSFDPNLFVTGISNEQWKELIDPKLRPQFNRAIYGAYNPGSIFKIVTALACLESGLDPNEIYEVKPDPQDPGKGCVYVGRRKIKDTASPGKYDFHRAFLKSSNAYFVNYGLATGLPRLLEMGHRFHLGKVTGILPRQEVTGYFPQHEEVAGRWSAGNAANVCIGQEITVTPIQMAVMTAAIANGGKVLRPRLVQGLETLEPEGLSVRNFPTTEVVGVLSVSHRTLDLVRTAMLADVEDPEGTGRSARVEGLQICAKTGTAQITRGGRVVDHTVWFVSFAPFDNPRYAVVVMVESGGSGGGTCGPIARRIYQAIQQRERNAPPRPNTLVRSTEHVRTASE